MDRGEGRPRVWVNISHPSQASSGDALSIVRSHIGKYYRNRATSEQRAQLFKTSKSSSHKKEPWDVGPLLRVGKAPRTIGPEPPPEEQHRTTIEQQKQGQVVLSAARNKHPKGEAQQQGTEHFIKPCSEDGDENKTTLHDEVSGRNDWSTVAFEMASDYFQALYNDHEPLKPFPLRGADVIDPFRTSTLSRHPNSFTLLRFYQDWTPVRRMDLDLHDELVLLPLLAYNATLMTNLNLTSKKDPAVHNLIGRALHIVRESLQTPSRTRFSPMSSALSFLMMCSLFQSDHEAAQAHLQGIKSLLFYFGYSFHDLPLSIQQMIIYCDLASRVPSLGRPIFDVMAQENQSKGTSILPSSPFRLARGKLKELSLVYKDDHSRHILQLVTIVLDSFDDAMSRDPREENLVVQIMYYRVYVSLVDLDEIPLVHYNVIQWRKKQLLQLLWRLALVVPIRHEYAGLFNHSVDALESVLESEQNTQHPLSGSNDVGDSADSDASHSRQNISSRYAHFLGRDEPSNMNDLVLGYADVHAEMTALEHVPRDNVSLLLRRQIYGPIFLHHPVTPQS
ncbi:hypothetical protein PV08_01536 [Exophiala spinifera]|uniref:Uncharacterized protein n=1 Tax=Exophiala spinifera TaxID=91928 RepID=A0A0D2A861_9EURO|nr:uncharacterized protein PV08_01536 [Exophiala spinifera]KIW20957.1 hypothetical protein PV08_01536 [Exophiala spinifera]